MNIPDTFKSVTSFLQAGKTPPNTPDEFKQDLSKINFLASKKFFVVFTSVIIISIFYASSILVLFATAPFPSLTGAFVTLFVETLKIFSIIIGAYLSLQTTLDWKMNSNSSTVLTTENINIVEHLSGPKEDDYTLEIPTKDE